MKGLVNDVFGISGLYPARKLAKIGRCHYHSTIIQAIDDEILVKVNVGIGGKVDLRIRHPPRPETNSPIIITLKRGIPTATPNDPCIKDLAVGANATVVMIDYRLSKQNAFPIPIHTVGTWI